MDEGIAAHDTVGRAVAEDDPVDAAQVLGLVARAAGRPDRDRILLDEPLDLGNPVRRVFLVGGGARSEAVRRLAPAVLTGRLPP